MTASSISPVKPQFVWTASTEPGVTYDFVIHKARVGMTNKSVGPWFTGPQAYYREALPAPEHVVEEDLLPRTEYVWSVRTRANGNVSKWSTFDDREPNKEWFYPFQTTPVPKS